MPLPPERSASLVDEILLPGRWLSTVSPPLSANFYVSKELLLPFAFGRAPVESFQVWQAAKPFRYFGPEARGGPAGPE